MKFELLPESQRHIVIRGASDRLMSKKPINRADVFYLGMAILQSRAEFFAQPWRDGMTAELTTPSVQQIIKLNHQSLGPSGDRLRIESYAWADKYQHPELLIVDRKQKGKGRERFLTSFGIPEFHSNLLDDTVLKEGMLKRFDIRPAMIRSCYKKLFLAHTSTHPEIPPSPSSAIYI